MATPVYKLIQQTKEKPLIAFTPDKLVRNERKFLVQFLNPDEMSPKELRAFYIGMLAVAQKFCD